MNRKINTIRNLSLVEKELGSANAGVVSVSLMKEGFAQFATNFVYQNKNIFFYLENEELLRTIRFDSLAKFTILKEKNVSKEFIDKNDALYLFSIVVTGSIREAEEQKTIKNVSQSFIEKYSGKLLYSDKDNQPKGKLLIVDSEELLAFDEIGF